MKKKRLLMLLTISMLFMGCATFPSPKEKFNATAKTYLITIKSLDVLRENGKFSQEEEIRIGNLIRAGYRAMDLWYIALEEGQTSIGAIDALEAILEELLEYQRRVENE